MPTIKVPSPLRSYTNGLAEVPVKGATVAAAMDDFIAIYPSLQPHLFNGKGELRPFVNLFLNSQDVRHLQGLQTSLAEDDRLMIVPSIAGGLEQVDHADCAPCKPVQRPALSRLKERRGDCRPVIELDASTRPDLADYWGVLSVPTTFMIDAQGRPRRVNHGLTSAERLLKQIEDVEGRSFYTEVFHAALRRSGILRDTP